MSLSKPIADKHKDFFRDVHDIARLIPKGRVTSYGAIAKALGVARSARVVGWAMNAAHQHPDIPAHRVVNRIGMLSGKMHFSSPNEMQERLESEGIVVEKDQVQDYKKHFWDPQSELEL